MSSNWANSLTVYSVIETTQQIQFDDWPIHTSWHGCRLLITQMFKYSIEESFWRFRGEKSSLFMHNIWKKQYLLSTLDPGKSLKFMLKNSHLLFITWRKIPLISGRQTQILQINICFAKVVSHNNNHQIRPTVKKLNY